MVSEDGDILAQFEVGDGDGVFGGFDSTDVNHDTLGHILGETLDFDLIQAVVEQIDRVLEYRCYTGEFKFDCGAHFLGH